MSELGVKYKCYTVFFPVFPAEYSRQVEEGRRLVSRLKRAKQEFTMQVEQLERLVEEEAKVGDALQTPARFPRLSPSS